MTKGAHTLRTWGILSMVLLVIVFSTYGAGFSIWRVIEVSVNVPTWLAFYFLGLFSAIFFVGFAGVAALALQSIRLHQLLSALSDWSF
ncbi:unnamed protein product [Oikopleura dioica]|uniref:Uncharacterized protein n=1 Tax=Oikopleura dioica TaxID=34765 RepID=E4YXG3_OIKDI|nr:unnamed protein product [Oikopleura dioica]